MSTRDVNDQSREAVSALAKAGASVKPGIVVSLDYPDSATVNIGGGTVSAICAGGQFPAVGDSVLVLQAGTALVCIGAMPKPAHGIVTATASGGHVNILADDGMTYAMNYNHLYTPAINDHVKLDWDLIGGYVVGPLAAAPTGDPNTVVPVAPTNPEGGDSGPSSYSRIFYPTDSGTYNPDYGTYVFSDVWCSDSTFGAYFYGTQISGSIPDGATITSIRVYLQETANYYPGSLATIGTHALTHKAGQPTPSNVTTVSAGSGWKTLTAAIGNALKTGAAFGLATDHGGYHIFSRKGGSSGALSISWTV